MKKKFSAVGIIPARFASTRFPGKLLTLIAGKTLLQRTYENAKRSHMLNEVYVATDDQRIFDHVREIGGHPIMTSPDCPTGTERIAEAISGNRLFDTTDIFINIQGDEPLLEPDVIESVIKGLASSPEAVMSTAIKKLTSEEDAYNPSVVKCAIDNDFNALCFSRALLPFGKTGKWRPDVTYYKHLGIYGYRREFLLKYPKLTPTPLQLAEDLEQLKVLEHGYKIKTTIVNSEAIGVDLPEDVKKVERFLV